MSKYLIISIILISVIFYNCADIKNNEKEINSLEELSLQIEEKVKSQSYDFIQNDIFRTMIYGTGYYCIVNSDGKILNHPSDQLINNNILDFIPLNEDSLKNINKDTYLIYEHLGYENLLYFHRFKNMNLLILKVPIKKGLFHYKFQ